LSSHAPCVVALGSHDVPSVAGHPARDDMSGVAGVCTMRDSAGTIFALACRRSMERNAVWWLAVGTDGLAH
jgi:hypothetical protein